MNQLSFKHLTARGLIALIFIITGCESVTQTEIVSSPIPLVPTQLATSTSSIVFTATAPSVTPEVLTSTWTPIADSPLANRVRTLLFDQSGNLWAGGPSGLVHWDIRTEKPTTYAMGNNIENTNVVDLSQNPDTTIWIGTFGNGITKYDGTNWQSFTTENGLPGNYILSQTVSADGQLWLSTKRAKHNSEPDQEFHFGRFDGNQWTNEAGGDFSWIFDLPNGSIVGARGDTGVATKDSLIGVYDGKAWNDLGLNRQTITAVTVAPDGVIWVATPDSIFRYINGTWHKILPPWAGQTDAHVSSIAVAEDGTAWFGFSYTADDLDRCGSRADYAKEWGVYRYDGNNWTHFTSDDGLVDNKICAITLDPSGNVWFGSFDKGISRFDGHNWKNYVIP
jgi:ligand-binding sensor domain-containing protein